MEAPTGSDAAPMKVGTMRPEAAAEVVEGMYEGGINFVTMLPESEFLTAQYAVLNDSRFATYRVCNETTGISMCAGAWVAGKKSAIMMGAAGLAVSSYAVAGVGIRHGMPVLLLITSRELGDKNWIFSIWQAHTNEPFLQAMKIPYARVDKIADVRKTIRDASATCFAWLKPYAVLLTGEVIF